MELAQSDVRFPLMRPSISSRLPAWDNTYLTSEFQEISSSNTTPLKYLNSKTRLMSRPLNVIPKSASESLA